MKLNLVCAYLPENFHVLLFSLVILFPRFLEEKVGKTHLDTTVDILLRIGYPLNTVLSIKTFLKVVRLNYIQAQKLPKTKVIKILKGLKIAILRNFLRG